MKTPVIIAAYNEAERIGKTLNSLDRDVCEPFVVVNGEEGLVETAAIASLYTDKVYVVDEQGKMPAIQLGFRKLYDYTSDAFSHPILFTDADTQVFNSVIWANSLSAAVEGPVPKSAAGLVLCNEGSVAVCGLRNINRIIRAKKIATNSYDMSAVIGSNLALNFANDEQIIDAIMNAPHIWPGEDKYMAHVIAGGDADRFTQLTDLGSAVAASSRYYNRLSERFLPKQERKALSTERYMARRAVNTTHLFDTQSMDLLAYEKISEDTF